MRANLPVVHTRATTVTANLYKKGDYLGSQKQSSKWENYLQDNFKEEEYEKHQKNFSAKNKKLNKAITHKHKKKHVQVEEKPKKEIEKIVEEEE